MKKQSFNHKQLSFSIGRPLPVLIEEIHNNSNDQNLKQAAQQIQDALQILETTYQTGKSNSTKTNQAIHEILTK